MDTTVTLNNTNLNCHRTPCSRFLHGDETEGRHVGVCVRITLHHTSHTEECLDPGQSSKGHSSLGKQVKIARTHSVTHATPNFNEPAIGLPCMEDEKPDGTTQHILWNMDVISGHRKDLDHISSQPTMKRNRRRGYFFHIDTTHSGQVEAGVWGAHQVLSL